MSLCKESRPEHCFDWITPDEVVRMVVQAVAVARAQSRQPAGESFIEDDGLAWATREDFACNLALVFDLQVKALAYRLGIAGGQFEDESVRLAKWGIESSPLPSVVRLSRRSKDNPKVGDKSAERAA